MKPLSRHKVDRRSSTHQFNRHAARTKMVNLHYGVRGGIRL